MLFSSRPLPEGLGEVAEAALEPVHQRHDPALEQAFRNLGAAHPGVREGLDDLRTCVRDFFLDGVVAALIAGYNAGLAVGATRALASDEHYRRAGKTGEESGQGESAGTRYGASFRGRPGERGKP